MIFFSGFGFKNEMDIFCDILELYAKSLDSTINPPYIIAGFSYGSQKAIDYSLSATHRINSIILLSPAFFNDKDLPFKEKQIRQFNNNKNIYMQYFLKNAGFIEEYRRFLTMRDVKDLHNLLYYRFNSLDLLKLSKRGVKIDVYIGENDNIINVESAIDFFKDSCVVHLKRHSNHFLKEVK